MSNPTKPSPPILKVPVSVLHGYLRAYGKKLAAANLRQARAFDRLQAKKSSSWRLAGKWGKLVREERKLAFAWQRLANLHFACFGGERMEDPRRF